LVVGRTAVAGVVRTSTTASMVTTAATTAQNTGPKYDSCQDEEGTVH
jgi:hypothetical protein